MDAWQLIASPGLSGPVNMQADLKLFHDLELGLIPSTLRVYSWKPRCISVGYSHDLIEKEGWDAVKRPTGGGIVFHNEAEVTYSLVTDLNNPILPRGMIPSYKKISEAVVCGLGKLGVNSNIVRVDRPLRPVGLRARPTRQTLCFDFPAEYEIVVGGKKIVGSAQKRGKKALLQQGSIFVRRTEIEGFSEQAVSVEEVLGRSVIFKELKEALIAGFSDMLGIQFH